jgi:hypothetical protein
MKSNTPHKFSEIFGWSNPVAAFVKMRISALCQARLLANQMVCGKRLDKLVLRAKNLIYDA